MGAVVSIFGLTPRYIGGSEIYARELARQLDAYGWHCVICFLGPPPPEVFHFLDRPNISIEVLENSSAPNFSTIKQFVRIIWKYRPQILHLHLVGFVGCYPWLGRLLSVKRVFFTDHGSHASDYVPRQAPAWKCQVVRFINWPITKVLCVSEYNRACMTTLNLLPAARFERVYNAVDFSLVTKDAKKADQFRLKHGIPADSIVVLQVSWIIPEKGIDDVLAAASLVLAKNPQVHFVLVGEGERRPEYMKLAQKMGLQESVTWTGLVQDPFGEGIYEAADIVCQASRWQEAFGQVIAEAMTCNKPVVGTRVGGIPELIDDGHSGFLVERGDIQALAEKILLLAGDRELRERLGRAGRAIAKAKFDLEYMVSQVLSLYDVDSLDKAVEVKYARP
jgi:glycosyltransferase involved in cell wall biosynthesis